MHQLACEKQAHWQQSSSEAGSWAGKMESMVWPLRTWPPVTVVLSVHSQWFSVLSQVHSSTDQEIREMHDEQANPQNAVVSDGWVEVGCPKSGFVVVVVFSFSGFSRQGFSV